MYFEVVSKETPHEGWQHHGRLKNDDGILLWLTPDHASKEEVLELVAVVKGWAETAPVVEVVD